MRLKGRNSKRLFNGLHRLWAEFDPIGVMGADPAEWCVDDEYDSYLAGTWNALQSDDPETALRIFTQNVVEVRMGLSLANADFEDFVEQAMKWRAQVIVD
jgi:hypothetical protein